jgi:hypothetical protein
MEKRETKDYAAMLVGGFVGGANRIAIQEISGVNTKKL